MKILGIGNAIIDVICKIDEKFITENNLSKGKTRQLGDGQTMANKLGIPVVYDFRTKDMKKGGQGAPLCPIYHAALLKKIGATSTTAMLNLGGLGNLSCYSKNYGLIFIIGLWRCILMRLIGL